MIKRLPAPNPDPVNLGVIGAVKKFELPKLQSDMDTDTDTGFSIKIETNPSRPPIQRHNSLFRVGLEDN